jgi:hypothetical protein
MFTGQKCQFQFCWLCLADYKEIHRIGAAAHKENCMYHGGRVVDPHAPPLPEAFRLVPPGQFRAPPLPEAFGLVPPGQFHANPLPFAPPPIPMPVGYQGPPPQPPLMQDVRLQQRQQRIQAQRQLAQLQQLQHRRILQPIQQQALPLEARQVQPAQPRLRRRSARTQEQDGILQTRIDAARQRLYSQDVQAQPERLQTQDQYIRHHLERDEQRVNQWQQRGQDIAQLRSDHPGVQQAPYQQLHTQAQQHFQNQAQEQQPALGLWEQQLYAPMQPAGDHIRAPQHANLVQMQHQRAMEGDIIQREQDGRQQRFAAALQQQMQVAQRVQVAQADQQQHALQVQHQLMQQNRDMLRMRHQERQQPDDRERRERRERLNARYPEGYDPIVAATRPTAVRPAVRAFRNPPPQHEVINLISDSEND